MQMAGMCVKQADADADTLIVSTAPAVSESKNRPVDVVGTDTDLLVMLVAQASTTTDIFMLCSFNPVTAFNIKEIQNAVGDTRHYLMFLHAVVGCDTVSAICRQSKRKAFNMVHKKREYNMLDTFTNQGSTHDDVKRVGKTFILKLYGASNAESLDESRHIAYKRAICRSSLSLLFQLVSLPPTSAAAINIHTARITMFKNGWATSVHLFAVCIKLTLNMSSVWLSFAFDTCLQEV